MSQKNHLEELLRQNKISRREFMRRAAMLGVVAGGASSFLSGCVVQVPQTAAPQQAPAGEEPAAESGAPAEGPKPDELVVVYWTVDGDEAAVEDITAKYEADYGVPVRWERTPNIEETWQKILSMSVAEEQLDLFVLHYYNMAAWIKEGVVQPIDDLPGLDEYMAEMPEAARALVEFEGHKWGLPYFRSLYTNMYNKVLWEQTGLAELPGSWEEVGEVAQKVKADGIVEYPIVWQAGVGREHINDTWYMLTGSIGGRLFDDELNPLMGEGSEAREMLKWWRQTFIDWEVADPDDPWSYRLPSGARPNQTRPPPPGPGRSSCGTAALSPIRASSSATGRSPEWIRPGWETIRALPVGTRDSSVWRGTCSGRKRPGRLR